MNDGAKNGMNDGAQNGTNDGAKSCVNDGAKNGTNNGAKSRMNDGAKNGKPRGRLLKALRDSLIILAIVLLVRVLDPLGLDQSLTERVQDIVVRVLSGWYPSNGQDRITVVLIDDAYLHWKTLNWPLGLAEHQSLLAKIQEAGAKSIFVDMVYANEHGDPKAVQGFARLIQDIVTGHPAADGLPAVDPVPVLLGDIFNPSMHKRRCADRDLPNGMALEAIACAATAVVPITLPVRHATYPANIAAVDCTSAWPTPAFAQASADPATGQLGCASAFQDRPPLFVMWGRAISARMAAREGYQYCRDRQDNRTALTVAQMVIRGLLVGLDKLLSDPLRCRYTDTLPASALFDPTAQGQALVTSLLSGRDVLVGTDLAGQTDRFVSPIYGDMPGVYFHAMALDNLLVAPRHGHDAIHYMNADERQFLGIAHESWVASIVIAIWIASEYLTEDLIHWVNERRRPRDHMLRNRYVWPTSLLIRSGCLLTFLYLGCLWDFIDVPAAWEIAFTVFVVEFSLKLAMGVIHVSKKISSSLEG